MSPRKTTTDGKGARDSTPEGSVSENWDQLTEQLEKLREDMSSISTSLQGLAKAGASEGRDRASAQMDDLARRARELTDEIYTQGARASRQASDQASALVRDVDAAISRNPMTAIIIALGLGFLIGLTSRRR